MKSLGVLFSFLGLLTGGLVQAQTPSKPQQMPSKHIELPVQCLAHAQFPCAIQILERGELAWGEQKFRAAPQSKFVLHSSEQLQLLEGQAWLLGMDGQNLKFGEIEFQMQGDVHVLRDKDRLTVTALTGLVGVSGPRGESFSIPAGFQNWYHGLSAEAEVEQGVVKAFDPTSFITHWLEIVGTDQSQFAEVVALYRQNQRDAVQNSAKLYKDVLQIRRIASEKSDKEQADRRRRQEQENRKFRQMFRQKFFEGSEPQS